MVGIVGFDGGYRPAVALALPPDELGSDEGEEEGGEPPPDETGACCNPDGSCDDGVTEFDCTKSGGTFQGVGTDCSDATCPTEPTGACCVDADCSIETEGDCTGMGGIYQGDNTTCFPNPCGAPLCACGFEAFDGSGRKFLTRTRVSSLHIETAGTLGPNDWDMSATKVEVMDPDTCEVSCIVCEGSVHFTSVDFMCDTTIDAFCISGAPCSDEFGLMSCISQCGFTGSDGCDAVAQFNTTHSGPCPHPAVGCDFVIETTSISATELAQDVTWFTTGSGNITITLSDECTPV